MKELILVKERFPDKVRRVVRRKLWLWGMYLEHAEEKLIMAFVWRLPIRVIHWAVVRAAVIAEPNFNPSTITADEMLERLRDG